MTPLMRMLTPNLQIHANQVVETIIYWKMQKDTVIPERATPLSAGLDLCSVEMWVIPSGKMQMISTGLGCMIPKNHYGQIATRSSMALKGARVVGGVIDADYQGEIKVLMCNQGQEPLPITKGQKVAQMLLIPVNLSQAQEGQAPKELTLRGDKGFGSSNVTNVGAKIWVQNSQGPPSPAEVIAVGKDRSLLIMRPGKEKWEYIPQEKCYLRE
ncbi:dUTP metabolic process [Pristimantis euphronides]